jgi:PAS domain S-box-containing protein
MQASSASDPIPDEPARGHSSWWVRLFIRILAIPGFPWVMFALAILATAVVCQVAWESHQEREEIKFEADTTVLRNAMRERLHRYGLVVQGLGGLFAASETVDPGEFRSYVDSLDMGNCYPGISAVGYVEWVDHARRDDFLLDMDADARGSDAPFRIWPSGDRPDYLVLRLLEPLEANRRALGFDLGSETARRRAAMSAGDSGTATLTSKVELVQAVGTPGGILFQPIYASESIPATASERRAHLRGWVCTAFLVGHMMEGVQQLTKSNLDYELFDGTTPSPDKLLCSSLQAEPSTSGKDLSRSSTMTVFGQPWTLRVRCVAGAAGPAEILPFGLLAGGGFLMSVLILGITHSMATTSRRAVMLATGMTGELRRQEKALRTSEERLALVIEGSNDGIWDWNLITNDVYFSRRWKGMLGYEDHEVENVFPSWEELLHPDERDHVLSVVKGYIAGKSSSYQLEHRLRQKDGNYRSILARGVVSRDSEGKPVRMAGSHFDLTDLKKAENELRETNEELQRSQARLEAALVEVRTSHEELKETQLELIQAAKLESVGSLAAGVAHEVKNPLQIMVMGLAHLEHRFDGKDEDTRITLADT